MDLWRIVGYWGLSILALGAWTSATVTVYRNGWWRFQPWFCRWLAVQTVQAGVFVAGGAMPSAWYATHVWLPVECFVLAAVIFMAAEILPWRLSLIAAVGAVIVMPTMDWAHPSSLGSSPHWFAHFTATRGLIWGSFAAALTIHLATLVIWPARLVPGAFRSWCWLAVFAAAKAATGWLVTTDAAWISTRSIYLSIATICCVRWVLLAPMFREAYRAEVLPPPAEDAPPGGTAGRREGDFAD